MSMSRLVAVLFNVSEGRCFKTLEKIANSAASCPPATVLNIFADKDYNRSVLTIVAPPDNIVSSVLAAAVQAFDAIHVDRQTGVHPRLGSVDLVPFYPLTEAVSVDECADLAHEFARRLTAKVCGSGVFFFGRADPEGRDLVARRKEVSWFNSAVEGRPDLGEASRDRGLTGVGASHYVTNFNVSLATADVSLGRAVAARIRASAPGGLPGVQAMAFPHDGAVEVACNVEACPSDAFPPSIPSLPGLHGNRYASPDHLEARIRQLASEHGVSVAGQRVVGFLPSEAASLSAEALVYGDGHVWRRRVDLGRM